MIERIDVHPVTLPMVRPFTHAGNRRTRTASVLVSVEADGVRGWGEGAPRLYVTGETVETVCETLAELTPQSLNAMIDLGDFGSAMCRLAELDLARLLGGAGRPQPAAAAALEIALFDLICRVHGQPGIAGLRSVPAAAGLLCPIAVPKRVSLVLDLNDQPAVRLALLDPETRKAVRHVKLKATADIAGCVGRVADVRDRVGPDVGISVDVNGDWDPDTAVRAAKLLRPLAVTWLEEPVAARDWAAMRRVQDVGGVPVMLDESCSGLTDLETAAAERAAAYVNARISKCGGIFPTLALIAAAREQGIGAQLGVHVAEVGPLWAAARLVSCAVSFLVTVEAGKQEEWFPTPYTDPPYAVDRRGYLAHPLTGAGIGIVPSQTLLDTLHPNPKGSIHV